MPNRTRHYLTLLGISGCLFGGCTTDEPAPEHSGPRQEFATQANTCAKPEAPRSFDDRVRCTPSPSRPQVSDAFRLGLSPEYNSVEGSGAYGCWTTGELGLPAYAYDHTRAAGREYTAQPPYHMLGNTGSLAHSYADGYHVLFSTRTFPRFANYFRPATGAFSGGFGYVYDASTNKVWSTYQPLKPEGAQFKTTWGMGYARKEVRHADVELVEDTFSPVGDDEVLVQRIVLTNRSSQPKQLSYYSYWDWEPYIIKQYVPDTELGAYEEDEGYVRTADATNGLLLASVDSSLLTPDAKGPQDVFDPSAREAFFSLLGDNFDNYEFDQGAVFGPNPTSPQISTKPTLRSAAVPPASSPLRPSQTLFFTEKQLTLAPGESRVLYTAYGMTRKGQATALVAKYRQRREQLFDETVKDVERKSVKFVPGNAADGWLGREVAWDSYYLNAGVMLEDGFTYSVPKADGTGQKQHPGRTINQNSVYMLGQGQNMAPRDIVQFVAPMIYSNPKIAREVLGFLLSMARSDGRLPFGSAGLGSWSAADFEVPLLSPSMLQPNDLGFWVQWAVVEYVYATRDFDFLKERFKYFDQRNGTATHSVVAMLDRLLAYQTSVVRVGVHGLVRLMKSDWADFLSLQAGNPSMSAERGSSTFTTALLLGSLPRLVELVNHALSVGPKDAALQRELNTLKTNLANVRLDQLKIDMMKQWKSLSVNDCGLTENLGFFNRAYLFDKTNRERELGAEHLWAESNSFALLAEPRLLDKSKLQQMLDTIQHPTRGAMTRFGLNITSKVVGAHDPTGTALPGSTTWYSLSGALIRGLANYADLSPDAKTLAWEELRRSTLRNHAEQAPEMFYGIISGADAWETGHNAAFTGEALLPDRTRDADGQLIEGSSWLEDFGTKSIAMTKPGDQEHSINNMHSHAHLIHNALRLAGVRATKTGYVIKPVMLVDAGFGWESETFGVRYEPSRITGKLRPLGGGRVSMTVTLTKALTNKTLVVKSNGKTITATVSGDTAEFNLDLSADQETQWSIEG